MIGVKYKTPPPYLYVKRYLAYFRARSRDFDIFGSWIRDQRLIRAAWFVENEVVIPWKGVFKYVIAWRVLIVKKIFTKKPKKHQKQVRSTYEDNKWEENKAIFRNEPEQPNTDALVFVEERLMYAACLSKGQIIRIATQRNAVGLQADATTVKRYFW